MFGFVKHIDAVICAGLIKITSYTHTHTNTISLNKIFFHKNKEMSLELNSINKVWKESNLISRVNVVGSWVVAIGKNIFVIRHIINVKSPRLR